MRILIISTLIFMSSFFATHASAQISTEVPENYEDVTNRPQHLVDLAAIMGKTHHLQKVCRPHEDELFWLTRFQQLIEMEKPLEEIENRMTAQFDLGFTEYQGAYPECYYEAEMQVYYLKEEAIYLIGLLSFPFRDDGYDYGE